VAWRGDKVRGKERGGMWRYRVHLDEVLSFEVEVAESPAEFGERLKGEVLVFEEADFEGQMIMIRTENIRYVEGREVEGKRHTVW
jgi:hypothetical protein